MYPTQCSHFFRIITLVSSFFLFSINPVTSLGQQPFLLADTTKVYRIDTHISFFIDTTNSLTADEVLTPEFQHRFTPSTGNMTFGYLKDILWLKIQTRTTNLRTNWYLEIPAPYLEYVDFFQLKDNILDHSRSGYYLPHSERILSHTAHVLPLHFGRDSINTVFVKIAGNSPKTFPLNILEKEKFIARNRTDDLWYGGFFGILIVMFFYNLFIYLSLRQSNYLLYIFVIICTLTIFSSTSGYASKFLWPENPAVNFYTGRMSLGALTIMLSIFTIRFLEVRRYSTVMFYALLALIPLSIIANILVARHEVSSAGNNLISISTILYLTSGIVCRVKGNKTASYFIVAWSIYFLGGLFLTLRNSGVFDYNFWTTHFVEIGAAAETSIIAFALGDRYRRYKREKEEAQLLALKIQQEATEKLELKVQERTAELDSFFYRISHDLKGPISSLLGLSSLAKIDIKDEQALMYIEKQHGQVERLNHIIKGLINLTKTNQADLQLENIDFNKLVDECVASLNEVPHFHKVSISKDVQPGIVFRSHWVLLNAILQNLIENAIKYSGEKDPYVHIGIRMQSNAVVIEVEDNGQGIPAEHQKKIFEMFYRATHQAKGTGLGLYILKRSVDRLQGTIDVISTEGKGSTFIVKLPVLD